MELRQILRAWGSHPSHVRQRGASKIRRMNSREIPMGISAGIPAEMVFLSLVMPI